MVISQIVIYVNNFIQIFSHHSLWYCYSSTDVEMTDKNMIARAHQVNRTQVNWMQLSKTIFLIMSRIKIGPYSKKRLTLEIVASKLNQWWFLQNFSIGQMTGAGTRKEMCTGLSLNLPHSACNPILLQFPIHHPLYPEVGVSACWVCMLFRLRERFLPYPKVSPSINLCQYK